MSEFNNVKVPFFHDMLHALFSNRFTACMLRVP